MANAPGTIDGWYALHMLYRVDWARLRALQPGEREEGIADAEKRMAEALGAEETHRGSSGFYWLLGHKGDLMAVHLRPTLDALAALENDFAKGSLGDCLTPSYSYLSVVELSTHGSGGRTQEAQEALEGALRARLEPNLPHTRYICFYPMSKLRGEDRNWYMLSAAERQELMRSHGLIGREYAGKVQQIITGSMGLDDWEWGVDLFAEDPLQFKKIVYEMRFDEVSARYALFGAFFVGLRIEAGDLRRYLAI
ncbi:MAG: heme-dependent peroxidase [Thermaerobacter sp.]|nr:heme-dependent peroxidase [Thermaerobacter sp.]